MPTNIAVDFHIFSSIASKISAMFYSWLMIPSFIIGWVLPVILTGLTIQIMMQGYGIMRGIGGQDHLIDVFFKSLRAFLVVSLCLGAGLYAENVLGIAVELKDGLVHLFSPSSAANNSSYAVLDKTVQEAIVAFKKIILIAEKNIKFSLNQIQLIGLVYFGVGFALLFCFACYAIVAAINLLIIDFSLQFIFAVGPLFIACMAFSATTNYFNTWLVAVLKFIFTAVAITAIIGLSNKVLSGYAAGLIGINDGTDYVGLAVGAFGTTGILILLTMRASSIAADMVGGAALSLVNATPIVRNLSSHIASKSGSAAAGAARTGAYGVGRATGAAANTQFGQQFANATSGVRQSASSVGTLVRVMQGKTGAAYSTPERRAAMNRRAGNVRGAFSSGYNDSSRSGIGSITRG